MFVIVGVLALAKSPAFGDDQKSELPPQLTDVRLVAFTVLYEATNQPELGQQLVAHVAVNRWRDSGMSVEEVVFQPGQFCAWTHHRKVDWLGCEIWNAEEECFTNLALERVALDQWNDLLVMSAEVLAGKPEPVGYERVRYFDNPKFWIGITEDGLPPWVHYKESLGCIADHCFWR